MKTAHDKIAAGLRDAIATAPSLTKPEMARLVEIWKAKWGRASFRDSPATTAKLADKGLVERRGGKIAKTGRVVWHAEALITESGAVVLAGLPKED